MVNNSLVLKYEAGGDPAAVSSGSGDLGGRSYGTYQFSSSAGVVDDFVNWLCNYPQAAYANYGRVLTNALPVNSAKFVDEWRMLGTVDTAGFQRLQDEYAGDKYYNAAYYALKKYHYNMEKHTEAMKAVIFSRAIQYGAGNMPELYTEAARRLGYPNLSYIDDRCFDRHMIEAIYDFLADECRNAYQINNGMYHSPKDWANGSRDVVKNGLLNRFECEKVDALRLLEKEGF